MESSNITTTSTWTSTPVDNVTGQGYAPPFSNTAIIVSASFIIPMAIFGICSNTITIIVIAKSKNLRSIFNSFILSLSFSDLLSASISPLFLYRRTWGFDEWGLPDFFCRLYWGTDMMTSFTTSHHIMVYSFLRLLSITRPQTFRKIRKFHAAIIISTIWFVCFSTGFVVFVVIFQSATRDRYSNLVTAQWPACTLKENKLADFSYYLMIGYGFHLYIPLVGVLLFSSCLAAAIMQLRYKRMKRAVRSGTTTRNVDEDDSIGKKEKKAILQVTLIVGSYLLGYIPMITYFLFTYYYKAKTSKERQVDWILGMVEYICLRFSECMNPIFYNVSSRAMRKETIAFLRSCGLLCKQIENSDGEKSRATRTTDVPTQVTKKDETVV